MPQISIGDRLSRNLQRVSDLETGAETINSSWSPVRMGLSSFTAARSFRADCRDPNRSSGLNQNVSWLSKLVYKKSVRENLYPYPWVKHVFIDTSICVSISMVTTYKGFMYALNR